MRLAMLFLGLWTATAQAAPPELRVPVERYKLPNGLTVILHEDHQTPNIVVQLCFHVGSKDEKPGRTGFAHLFEHLMFMGTKNVPGSAFDQIMEAEGGQNNASTGEDRTLYFESGPANLLETFLYLESDRLATLPDAMTRAKLDLQRDVVKNERRERIENQPYGGVELVVPEKLYPAGHPYHHPIIGSHADLSAATIDDVKAFFRTYYVPSNASLTLVGDFQPDEARRLVERYFGWMPVVPEPPHVVPPPVELPRPVQVTLRDHVQLEQLTLVWHAPAEMAPGDAEHELLAAVLGGGKSSRLERALVYEQALASEVQVDAETSRFGGTFVIRATAQPGHTAQELERAIDAELAALCGPRPAEAREVERARTWLSTRLLEALASPVTLAEALAELEYVRGDASELERSFLTRYTHVGPSDLLWVAHGLRTRPRLAVTVLPDDGAPRKGKEKPHAR